MYYSIMNPMGFSTDTNPHWLWGPRQQGFVVKQLRVKFGLQAHQPQADITLAQVMLGGLSLQLDTPDTTFY